MAQPLQRPPPHPNAFLQRRPVLATADDVVVASAAAKGRAEKWWAACRPRALLLHSKQCRRLRTGGHEGRTDAEHWQATSEPRIARKALTGEKLGPVSGIWVEPAVQRPLQSWQRCCSGGRTCCLRFPIRSFHLPKTLQCNSNFFVNLLREEMSKRDASEHSDSGEPESPSKRQAHELVQNSGTLPSSCVQI